MKVNKPLKPSSASSSLGTAVDGDERLTPPSRP
uniref:Uncharacterized protein n=1 Tax=Anguilla anguilla TaxID=7936 RepID=A0A0E9SMD2_ANGAN